MSDTLVVPLTQGQHALIDAQDAGLVLAHRWQAKARPGGRGWVAATAIDGKRVFMHRLICDAPPGRQVDHRSRNTLDNRRGNLRLATSGQNQANKGIRRDNTSGYIGVSFSRSRQVWQASICKDREQFHLGFFTSAQEAAIARDCAARFLFDAFAVLNFPDVAEYPYTADTLLAKTAPHSIFRGVIRRPGSGRWRASVYVPGTGQKWLGQFSTEEDAARAYDQAARELLGPDARLNFP